MGNAGKEMKQEFIEEVREHLEGVEQELMVLESRAGNAEPELINNIFRSIHSIKGASGFLGYTGVVNLTHRMETLLQMMRKAVIPCSPEVTDALLSANDILKSMLDDIDSSGDMDLGPVLRRIDRHIHGVENRETRKEMASAIALVDAEGADTGFTVTEFQMNSIPEDLPRLYLLKFNLFELEKKKKIKPLSLFRNLVRLGMLVDTRIETRAVNFDEGFSDTPLMYLALYATGLDRRSIAEICNLNDREITEIRREAKKAPDRPAPPEPAEAVTVPEEEGDRRPPEPVPPSGVRRHAETVRIRVQILDQLMKLAGEMVLVRNNLLAMTQADPTYQKISQRLNIVTTELQETVMQTRMQPVENLFSKLPRIARDLSIKLKKEIDIQVSGEDVELDKTILESLTDPLVHLIRNACDHGIDSPEQRKKMGKPPAGRITVRAFHEAGQISILVEDDGRGMDPDAIRSAAVEAGVKTREAAAEMSDREIFNLILRPGFSTAESVSDVSGRGVGMDVVKTGVEKIGGSIEIDSRLGKGTRIHLRIPLTLAIIPCMIVEVTGFRFAIPQVNVKELLCLYSEEVYTKIECAAGQEVYRLRDRLLPIVRLNEILKRPDPLTGEIRGEIADAYAAEARKTLADGGYRNRLLNFAVVKMGAKRYGLVIDRILGVEEIVVNPMPQAIKGLNIYSGTTIMGDGSVAMILDIEGLSDHAAVRFNLSDGKKSGAARFENERQTVLLFKNGAQEQFAVPLPMIRRIEQIRVSDMERVGDREFIPVDGISIPVVRLNDHMNVSPCIEKDEMLLLLPKHIRRPFGILISEVVDTSSADLSPNAESYMEDGLLGTALIRGRMTLVLDLFRVIELAEPDWFAERKNQKPPPGKKKRVLLVEDTAFFRNLVSGYLKGDGYEVSTVENGAQGVQKMSEEDFDIIVSDLEMPVMDGWRFMKHISRTGGSGKIPAIALTALDTAEDRARALEAGFDAYQVKLDREALLVHVSELLNQ